MELHMAAGIFGAAMLSVMQLAGQRRWLSADQPAVLLVNLAGAALLLVSLFAEWNTATCLLAGLWIAVSLFGLGYGLMGNTLRRVGDDGLDDVTGRISGPRTASRHSARL